MPDLKFSLKFNEGGIGVPLEKLAGISQEAEAFVSMFSEDLGITGEGGEWIALNFRNGSVIFDCQKSDLSLEIKERSVQALRAIATNDQTSEISAQIRPATRSQYYRMAGKLDHHERINVGLYTNGEREPGEWHSLTNVELEAEKVLTESIAEVVPQIELPKATQYYGEIQGIVHAFYKEVKRPRLVVRELCSQTLIDCFFQPQMYAVAVDTLQEPEGVIFVEGVVTESRLTGAITAVEATDFRPAPLFDKDFYETFIGSVPILTGDLSSEDYIEQMRDDG